MSEYGDVIDIGNRTSDLLLEVALSNLKQSDNTSGLDIYVCVDCDDEIEKARKQAVPHAIRCVECQFYYDQQNR